RFILEQLAGDEAFQGDADSLTATGFNLLGPDMTDASDQAQRRLNTLDDMTDTAGLVFLGLTVGCARCHDHKFEPIAQSDYFRLQAFFAPAVFRRDLPLATPAQRQAHEAALRDYTARAQPLQQAMAAPEAPYRQHGVPARLARLSAEARAAHQTPAGKRTAAQKELVAKNAKLLTVTPAQVQAALSAHDRERHQE